MPQQDSHSPLARFPALLDVVIILRRTPCTSEAQICAPQLVLDHPELLGLLDYCLELSEMRSKGSCI